MKYKGYWAVGALTFIAGSRLAEGGGRPWPQSVDFCTKPWVMLL